MGSAISFSAAGAAATIAGWGRGGVVDAVAVGPGIFGGGVRRADATEGVARRSPDVAGTALAVVAKWGFSDAECVLAGGAVDTARPMAMAAPTEANRPSRLK
jgi:hypothetical protein